MMLDQVWDVRDPLMSRPVLTTSGLKVEDQNVLVLRQPIEVLHDAIEDRPALRWVGPDRSTSSRVPMSDRQPRIRLRSLDRASLQVPPALAPGIVLIGEPAIGVTDHHGGQISGEVLGIGEDGGAALEVVSPDHTDLTLELADG